MIRALFFDLDGTLLTSAGRISQSTLTALGHCRRHGIRVFVATARPPLLHRMLTLTKTEAEVIADGGVFYNGGCIICGSRRHYTTMGQDTVRLCVDALAGRPEANLALQMPNEFHSFRHPLPEAELSRWGVRQDETGRLVGYFERFEMNVQK